MSNNRSDLSPRETFRYVVFILFLYFVGQTVIVVLHEHAHSSAAWLLGYSPTPFTVVWGNPITMRGWDEGVPYDQLFPHRGNPAESIIGGIPLFMHSVFVALSLAFLLRNRPKRGSFAFQAVYWFLTANLAELVAYLWMRPFIPTGDTGRFNAGLNLTPWPLFLAGTALLLFACAVVVHRVVPVLDQFVGGGETKHWINVVFTGFFLFLWSSGFRILSLYPDPQWRWGLTGFVGFAAWMFTGLVRNHTQIAYGVTFRKQEDR